MSVKTQVLAVLEEKKGLFISGEELAEKLHCSRTAVWKAVNALRGEGYQISSGTNKGYSLELENDILSAQVIEKFLGSSQAPVFVYKEVSSTNEVLKEKMLLEKNRLPHGTMVLAEKQTQGKGRSGKSFYSPKDSGLYMSVLLRPGKTIHQSLLLTQGAAVAVCKGVEKVCGISLDIKWVNDLYYQGKKVCGILTEAVTDFETGDIDFAVVGMGILLYHPQEQFVGENPQGSIFAGRECSIDRNRLAGEIGNYLLEEAEREQVSPLYKERNLVLGRKMILIQKGRRRPVEPLEILDDGSLLVRNQIGEKETVYFGELQEQAEEKEKG